jgi:hypothetical protein
MKSRARSGNRGAAAMNSRKQGERLRFKRKVEELPSELNQSGFHTALRRCERLQRLDPAREAMLDRGHELVAVARVDGALGDAGLSGDLVERNFVEAAIEKEAGGGLQQRAVAALRFGVGRPSTRARHRRCVGAFSVGPSAGCPSNDGSHFQISAEGIREQHLSWRPAFCLKD